MCLFLRNNNICTCEKESNSERTGPCIPEIQIYIGEWLLLKSTVITFLLFTWFVLLICYDDLFNITSFCDLNLKTLIFCVMSFFIISLLIFFDIFINFLHHKHNKVCDLDFYKSVRNSLYTNLGIDFSLSTVNIIFNFIMINLRNELDV